MTKSSPSTASLVAGGVALTGAVAAASLWNNYYRPCASQDADKNDELAEFISNLHLVRKLSLTDSEKLKQIVNASLEYCYHDLPAHIVGDSKAVVRKRTPTDPEDTMQAVHHVINAIFNYSYKPHHGRERAQLALLFSHRTGNEPANFLCDFRKLTAPSLSRDVVYVEKGDMSVSSDLTDDTSASFFSDSLDEPAKIINSRSVSSDHIDDTSGSAAVFRSAYRDSLFRGGFGFGERTDTVRCLRSGFLQYPGMLTKKLPSVSSTSDFLEGIESSAKIINYEWDDEEYIEEKELGQTPCSGSDAAALMLASAFLAAQAFV